VFHLRPFAARSLAAARPARPGGTLFNALDVTARHLRLFSAGAAWLPWPVERLGAAFLWAAGPPPGGPRAHPRPAPQAHHGMHIERTLGAGAPASVHGRLGSQNLGWETSLRRAMPSLTALPSLRPPRLPSLPALGCFASPSLVVLTRSRQTPLPPRAVLPPGTSRPPTGAYWRS
jgi:hypothetical protein